MSESERISRLEEQVAYLEHSLDEVTRVLNEAHRAQSLLLRESEGLKQRLKELEGRGAAPTEDVPPPHY